MSRTKDVTEAVEPESPETESAPCSSHCYTPGPWRVDETKALGPMGIYSESARQELSGVCWFSHSRRKDRRQVEADARMIANAPTMFAMLVVAQDAFCSLRCPSIGIAGTPIGHKDECLEMTRIISEIIGG